MIEKKIYEIYFPFIAYSIVTIAYISRIPYVLKQYDKHPTLFIGSIILVSAYALLAFNKVKLYYQEKHEKHEKEEKDEKHEKHNQTAFNKYLCLAYGLLSAFFISSYGIPFNITVRFYDIFAAVGYSLLFINTLRPTDFILNSGLIIIAIYYFLGGIIKIYERNFDDVLLLLGRILLVIYTISYLV